MMLIPDDEDQFSLDNIDSSNFQDDNPITQLQLLTLQVSLYAMAGQNNPRTLSISGKIGSTIVQVLTDGDFQDQLTNFLGRPRTNSTLSFSSHY